MPHFVLKHWHPMAGVDFHCAWTPGTPAPKPAPTPFRTGFLLMGLAPTVFSKPIFSHMTDGFAITLEKGTDIGSLIPHIGEPSLTLPVEMLVSASKSHFGAARYKAENRVMACALLVCVNPNLNCGTPAPTPTGVVLAITTHVVEMTWADIFAGLAAMCFDIVMQWLMNKLGNALGNRITSAIMRRLRPSIWNNTFFRCLGMFRSGTRLTYDAAYRAAMFRATEQVLREWRRTGRIVGPVVGFLLGGPMGADVGTVTGWSPGGAASSGLGGIVEEGGRELGAMLDPPPAVTDYNSGPGAPPVANP